MDDVFNVPSVQLEGLTGCACSLIDLLVKRCGVGGACWAVLEQLRPVLTDKLCRKLEAKDDNKVTYY